MDYDEPHLTPNEKMQSIQWTKRPIGALVAAGSLWPFASTYVQGEGSLSVLNVPDVKSPVSSHKR
jgi:hypothetical protein